MAYKDKEKAKAQRAAYRAANPEKIKAIAAKYYAANSEKVKTNSAAYYAANLEKVKATNAARRAANPEKTKACNAAYRAANPEKVKATTAAWRKANPEKVKAITATFYAANKEEITADRAARSKADPIHNRLMQCKKRHKKRWPDTPFNLTKADINIPEVCPVFEKPFDEVGGWSVDRIDSSVGYVRGNVQTISWRANQLKRDATYEELVALGRWAEKQLAPSAVVDDLI